MRTPTTLAAFDRLVRSRADYRSHMTGSRPLRGDTFVITGKLDESLTRADAERLLASWGASVATKVTYFTDALLATDPARMTAKRREADRLRVAVHDERTFVSRILMRHLPTSHTPVAIPPLVLGDRITLLSMDDDPDPIPVGTHGTVGEVNFATRQAWVEWDNGRTLAIVLGKDAVEIL